MYKQYAYTGLVIKPDKSMEVCQFIRGNRYYTRTTDGVKFYTKNGTVCGSKGRRYTCDESLVISSIKKDAEISKIHWDMYRCTHAAEIQFANGKKKNVLVRETELFWVDHNGQKYRKSNHLWAVEDNSISKYIKWVNSQLIYSSIKEKPYSEIPVGHFNLPLEN